VHVPVSRVEPFTLVYKPANTKMDGLFERCVRKILSRKINFPVTRSHTSARRADFLLLFDGIASQPRN
jgi:hypothetical protein